MYKTYHANDHFNWGNAGSVNEKGAEFSNGSRIKKETAKDVQAGIGDTYQLCHATEAARWQRYGVSNAEDVMVNILKAVPLLPRTYIFLESTAESASGDFYNRWLNAIDLHDFLEGRAVVRAGDYVRVFAAWFQFDDSALRLTDEEKVEIQRTLDAEEEYSGEQQLIDEFGRNDNGVMRLGTTVENFDVWEQLAWRRYSIREECKRDKDVFERDYPSSWQSAFQKSGRARFNATGLSVIRKELPKRQPKYGVLEETKNGRIVFRPTEKGESKVIIYDLPKQGNSYILPVDPMTGAEQVGGKDPDWHAAFVLSKGMLDGNGIWKKPATAAKLVKNRWAIDVIEAEIWRLAKFYGGANGCKIAIEMEMDRGLTELLKLRGADLYQREIFNQREQKTTKALGWMTTAQTREMIIEKLAKAVREWDTIGDGIDIWDVQALEEMENFITKESGRSEAAEGYHDDTVLCIAIGLQLIEHATAYVPDYLFREVPRDLREKSNDGSGGSMYS
jgi:hypothetical protein